MNLSLDIINKLNKYIIGNIKRDFIFLHTVNRSNLKKRMKIITLASLIIYKYPI